MRSYNVLNIGTRYFPTLPSEHNRIRKNSMDVNTLTFVVPTGIMDFMKMVLLAR